MTTAYSQAELDEMEEQFATALPPVPIEADKIGLTYASALGGAGAPTGFLVKLRAPGRAPVVLFLNPLVARQLMEGIYLSGQNGGWWDGQEPPRVETVEHTTDDDVAAAVEIVSLTTAGAGAYMLARVARRDGEQVVGMDRAVATELMLIIKTAAEKFGWWDENLQLLPHDGASARITDLEVWRAAKQIIDQGHADPELAAAQKADAAYELGDMFNFNLWGRVANAVKDLRRQKAENEALN